MVKVVLVTGGAGYIGGAMVRGLITNDYKVVILDNLSSGHLESIPSEAKFFKGDILDKDLIDQILKIEKPDAVMHFAASIEAGESMKNPGQFFINNVLGAQTIIESCARNKVMKFVFSSTAAIFEGSNETLSEDSFIKPTNFYGQTKLMVENLLSWYGKIYGLKYAILRYFNAAGAIEDHGESHRPESHLIPKVLDVALGKTPSLDLYGNNYDTPDGTCIRDYIHISDLVDAHHMVLRSLEDKPFWEYNLGTGNGYSILQVVDMAREITGKEIKINVLPNRVGDSPRLVASSKKIHDELGWKPKNGLKEIIESAWIWHKYANRKLHT